MLVIFRQEIDLFHTLVYTRFKEAITKLFFETDEQTIIWDIYKNQGIIPESSAYDRR